MSLFLTARTLITVRIDASFQGHDEAVKSLVESEEGESKERRVGRVGEILPGTLQDLYRSPSPTDNFADCSAANEGPLQPGQYSLSRRWLEYLALPNLGDVGLRPLTVMVE
jgi:hypothetical protein